MSFSAKVVEYNGVESTVMVGLSELVNVGSKELELNNANKTKYRRVNIKFTAPNGKVVQMPAQLFNGNIARIKEAGKEFTAGESYLTTIRLVESNKGDGKMIPFAQISHLQGGIENLDAVVDMFSSAEGVSTKTAVNAEPVDVVA